MSKYLLLTLISVLVVITIGLGACATPAPPSPTYYTLSISVSPSAGAGSIYPSGGTYEAGTTVSLTAQPSSGYEFDHWGGDASGTSTSVTVTMNSDKSVMAYFTKKQYSLTTSVSPSGSGSVNPSTGEFDPGTMVPLVADANPGWEFDHWGGDAAGNSPTITITMNSDKEVVAYFTPIYEFTVPSFGKKSLSKNISSGETVKGSFSIGGTGFDIVVYIMAPSGSRVMYTVFVSEGDFEFRASESGIYEICFENKPPMVLSALSSKPITLKMNSTGWQIS